MSIGRLTQWRRSFLALFPERHLYIRSGGEMRGYVLTTRKQLTIAAVVAFSFLWMGVATASLLVDVIAPSSSDQRMIALQARYERLIADRDARLISYDTSGGTAVDRANSVERQQAALAVLLNQMRGGQGPALALASRGPGATPLARIETVAENQERLLNTAEQVAHSRAERLQYAMRLAGLDPRAFARARADGRGGPLISAGDPRALAVVLDVDPAFAARIQRAAASMDTYRQLSAASASLPLRAPAPYGTHQSSGFGVRSDPIDGEAAFHSGLDFAGPTNTPVFATAPGTVSFTGQRSGYGNVIEIDHGHGLKTRFAHLRTISVAVGQRVAIGTRIGGIGSTGRSTGPHLHYEVWLNGRAQNPLRFLRAGQYVQQAN
jgi:murein DD-endopeptidase MepM/ murein hydrolase activator NlpD